MELPYNPEDKASIIAYAKQLQDKTLRQVCDISAIKNNRKGKGHFGQILEAFYFFYKPNSNSEPDFPVAGLELKSSPLKRLANLEFRAKERLVLNIINYVEVVNQDFENSSFWKKNANILLVFYIHKADSDILDYLIRLVDTWSFPDTDLEIIKKDWELIRKKIADGKAHELSEGDTFYLGACTKGANATTTRQQPFNDMLAKQRAFSLKAGYVNHIIASISKDTEGVYGKLIPNIELAKEKTIEMIVLEKFIPYYGKTIEQIMRETGVNLNQDAKSFHANLTKAILGIALDKEIEEFEKADITVKAIRVESDGRIIESVSFKRFDYIELVKERWEESEFRNDLERKFLFIFFKENIGYRVLEKVKFWNMPSKDRLMAKRVWLHTKKIVKQGMIVKAVRPNGTRKTNFMGKSDNPISHVRPHARNADDTAPLPTADQLTQATVYTKHCFWLNNDYIRDAIYRP
jgi:DNA mismatch repair protein MutH